MVKEFFAGIPGETYEVEWMDDGSDPGRVKLSPALPKPGGQAQVWKVKIGGGSEWKGDYALKVFSQPINRTRHSRHQFNNEVKARFEDNRFISTMNQGVITRDKKDGMEMHCILRPWIKGQTLTEWTAEEPSMSQKIRVMKQIAGAVSLMHHAEKAQRLHNDLKPDNIIVKPDGKIVIIDFALCCAPDEVLKEYAGVNEFVGTERWTAPELIPYKRPSGDIETGPRNYSEQSDVWCLGSIFLYILTGKDLWEYVGDTLELDQIILSNGAFVQLCFERSGDNLIDYASVVPEEKNEWISEILNRSLQLHRDKRPDSVEFNRALTRKNGVSYKVSKIPKGMEADELRDKLREHFDCSVSDPQIRGSGRSRWAYVHVFGSEASPSHNLEGMELEVQDNWPKRKKKVQKQASTSVLEQTWDKIRGALPAQGNDPPPLPPPARARLKDDETKPKPEPPISKAPSGNQVFIDLLLPNGKIIIAYLDVNDGPALEFGRRELDADKTVSRKTMRLSLTSGGVVLEALKEMTLDSNILQKGTKVVLTGKHKGSVRDYAFEIELRSV